MDTAIAKHIEYIIDLESFFDRQEEILSDIINEKYNYKEISDELLDENQKQQLEILQESSDTIVKTYGSVALIILAMLGFKAKYKPDVTYKDITDFLVGTSGVSLQNYIDRYVQSTTEKIRNYNRSPDNVDINIVQQTEHIQSRSILHTLLYGAVAVTSAKYYRSNLVKKEIYIAILDARTSQICRDLHNTIFPINKGARPPMHPHCRSHRFPYRPGAKYTDYKSYGDWLLVQPIEVQQRAIGKYKTKLLNNNDINIDRFIKSDLKLSVKELKQKYQ